MNIINVFKKKLPEHQVAWCIAVPYTKEQFMNCLQSQSSDFIDSLSLLYGETDPELLWTNYESYAKDIAETKTELVSRNVSVYDIYNASDLSNAFQSNCVILTAHHHRNLESLEFLGGSVPVKDVVDSVPNSFSGYFDASSCYSDTFQLRLKLKAENAYFIASSTQSSLRLRLFLYRHIVKYMAKHKGIEYIEALRIISKQIISYYNENSSGIKDIPLGGKTEPKTDVATGEDNEIGDNGLKIRDSGHIIKPLKKEESALRKEDSESVASIKVPKGKLAPAAPDSSSGSTESSFCSYELKSLANSACSGLRYYHSERNIFKRFCNFIIGKQLPPEFISSCVYAPAQVRKDEMFLVQVYLFLDEETGLVKAQAQMIDKNAEIRQYKPLEIPIKVEDTVLIKLSMSKINIVENTKTLIWQGRLNSREFSVFVPKDYQDSTIHGTVTIFVNELPAGEMMFITNIVSEPKQSMAEVHNRAFSKIFVSYSHKDTKAVSRLVEGFRILNAEYFYDRHTLKTGDKFREEIFKWIETSDVFVLCWSKNAAQSEEVKKEKDYALEIATQKNSSLRIYPLSFKPTASLPEDMADIYNFGEMQ